MVNNSFIQSFGGIDSSLIVNKAKEIGKPIVVQFSKQLLHVSFSPFSQTSDLVALVFRKEVCIVSLKFREEDESLTEAVCMKLLQKIDTTDQVHSLCWSPESCLNQSPFSIVLAWNKTNDFSFSIVKSNITDACDEKLLLGHTDYINGFAFEPSGECLASVSDDLSCRVWDVKQDYRQLVVFYLLSPGVGVCWHESTPGLMVVGERVGTIRMYNVRREVALMSFQSDLGNLSALCWIPGNNNYLAALSGPNLVVWNTSSPSVPQSSTVVHPDGGRHLCFVTGVTTKIFSVGAPDNTLKRTILEKASTKQIASFKLSTNLSCHSTLPFMAVGVDSALQIWNTRDN